MHFTSIAIIIINTVNGGAVVKNPPANATDTEDSSSISVRKIPWSRKWQPTLVFLSGKFHGERSLVGYSPWGRKESDMTEHKAKGSVNYSN